MTGPSADDTITRAFEAHRPRLLRVAYATVGSVSEAEDCVQEAWLRLQAQDPGSIRDLGAWLTTTVSRLAYDMLGSARARRERYVGAPGLVMRDGDGVLTVIAFTIDSGRITALDVMRNPDKLTAVPDPG